VARQGAQPSDTVQRFFRRGHPPAARGRDDGCHDLAEYVAKSLVDDPDAVTVDVVEEDGATVIELHVAEDDMGGHRPQRSVAKRPDAARRPLPDGEPVQLEILADERLGVGSVRGVHGPTERFAGGSTDRLRTASSSALSSTERATTGHSRSPPPRLSPTPGWRIRSAR
jgi:hypothetical protein